MSTQAQRAIAGRLAEIVDTDGYPDGLTVVDENRIWMPIWDGAAVRCYAADGTLVHDLDVPVQRATSCTFGGGLDTLFVTPASNGVDEPHAGTIFCASGLASGRPANEARAGLV